MAVFSIIFAAVTSRVGAATYGVTTPGQQTLTNRFLPYAGSGTQLIGNSPAWRDSAGVLGINNYLEGLETLTPAAAVNLNFSTWRTKRITLNQNTIFTAINIPSASTNVQTMLLEVIGDGAFTVSFANVTWQTPEITTPEAGVVTLYALRGDNGAVKGYTQAVAASGVTTINPTDGYLPYRSNATTFANSPLITVTTNVANTGNFLLQDGNETYPSYSFTNGPTVGYFRDATGASAFSEGGAQIARLTLGALDLKTNMVIGWSELPGLQSSDWTMAANSTGFVWGFQASIKGKVAQNSGYTGAGTLFLSDDGTYKAAGSSPLWSSSSGNLSPSPAVDVVSIQSQSADAATNVVLVIDTATSWTNGWLGNFSSAGTNSLHISPFGSLLLGQGATNFWGASSTDFNQVGLAMVLDKNLDSTGFDHVGLNIDFTGPGVSDNYIDHIVYATSAASQWVTSDAGYQQWDVRAQNTNSYIRFYNGGVITLLQPDAAAAVTPYTLGTTVSHTSGNLLEIANNGTNKVTVDYSGNVTASAFTPDLQTVSYASSVTVDFSGRSSLWTVLAGDMTLASANLAAGRKIEYRIDNQQATNCNVILPSGWRFVSGVVTNVLAASKIGLLTARSYSTTDTNVVAMWSSE